MLLAIDSGNTNVVFGVFDGDRFVKAFRCANDPKRTADEYIVWLDALMKLNGLDASTISGSIIGSVVPETAFNLTSLCRRYFPGEPLVIGDPKVKLGNEALIEWPEQVGADRLINAFEANRTYGGPLIVIDFGTATTFDVVDAAGNYCGGAIAPGINLSLEALYMASAKLPLVEIAAPPTYIGKETKTAMQSGIFWGYVCMIEGMVARLSAEFDAPMKVIATGGLSELFAEKTAVIEETDRSLTLRGLAEIYKRNAR
ncbi:type III pantothenate kinase [Marivibrio halodurans]|uniref:Type III pantothenate kinase n=1 Tax=Marivibrio halodurans TaxID=2039722 RepID=A0A8J7SG63_9PROT|nr:type III pantothenate kinase [Marivibrio halodurans]MBP5855533.1 type III pantothenate kinase [Marivibrio halodurans]